VQTEPKFNLGKSKTLFNIRDIGLVSRAVDFDISPDGKRFLTIKRRERIKEEAAAEESAEEESAEEESQRIIVVTNWFEELKEKVPVE